MRLFVTSDWHVDWSSGGVPRIDDVGGSVLRAVDAAIKERADLFLFLGDLCDPDSGPVGFRAAAMAIGVARALEEEGIPSVWLAGNHDVIEDGSGATTLDPLKAYGMKSHGMVRVADMATLALHADVEFWLLPFTPSSRAYDPGNVLCTFNEQRGHASKHPVVIAGHLQLPGIHPGSETTDMARGRDVNLPVEAARAMKPAVMLNGHYHQQQCFEGVWIPGSLERLTFGEEHNAPGWLVVDV